MRLWILRHCRQSNLCASQPMPSWHIREFVQFDLHFVSSALLCLHQHHVCSSCSLEMHCMYWFDISKACVYCDSHAPLGSAVLSPSGVCVAQCPVGTYVTSTGTCQSCNSNCATCSGSASNCLTCASTFSVPAPTCSSTCAINLFG